MVMITLPVGCGKRRKCYAVRGLSAGAGLQAERGSRRLSSKSRNQIEAWEPETEEILCLCDIQGGFPMEACLTQLPDKKVKIITETTLTLLTYLLVHRNGSQSSRQLIDNALLEAKEAIHVIDPQILFADQKGEAS